MTRIEEWVEIAEVLATGERRACAVAGVLAELGITRLVFVTPGGEHELAARVTDLPGVLDSEMTWTLRAQAIGVVIERRGSAWRYRLEASRAGASVGPALTKALRPGVTGAEADRPE
jgi:hypothetical protein